MKMLTFSKKLEVLSALSASRRNLWPTGLENTSKRCL